MVEVGGGEGGEAGPGGTGARGGRGEPGGGTGATGGGSGGGGEGRWPVVVQVVMPVGGSKSSSAAMQQNSRFKMFENILGAGRESPNGVTWETSCVGSLKISKKGINPKPHPSGWPNYEKQSDMRLSHSVTHRPRVLPHLCTKRDSTISQAIANGSLPTPV